MLTRLYIDNFKSLKNVEFDIPDLGFFCGPNGSGKTNLAEAFDFLSKVFRSGLSFAVAEKGGFYNICFRRQRRSRSSISFRIHGKTRVRFPVESEVSYRISFSLQTRSETIRSEYYVDSESYDYEIKTSTGISTLRILRKSDTYDYILSENFDARLKLSISWIDEVSQMKEILRPSETELMARGGAGLIPFPPSIFGLQNVRVFRVSPRFASLAGAPSVSGELGKYGENLPSALDYLYAHDKPAYDELVVWVRDVVPDLEYLRADYTQTKQMGLFLQEKGFGASWYAEDLSDGTLTAIALFVAVLDKRNKVVFIEEPENSLHPWILRRFIECCREQSKNKQILISTQSPLAVASADPGKLFLVERFNGETSLTRATDRDPSLETILNKKFLDLGEYWSSGGLRAVPRTPEPQADLFKTREKEG
jgi:predicted ATPase